MAQWELFVTEMCSDLRGRVDESLSALRSALPDAGKAQKETDQAGKTRANLLFALHAVGRTGSMAAILEAEKAIVDNELARYASSDIRRRFLKDALVEIDEAVAAVKRVQDGKEHRDQMAYQFFASYSAELIELAKVLDTDEQQILAVRHSNIKIAQNLYTDHQAARIQKEEDRTEAIGLIFAIVTVAVSIAVGGYFLITSPWTTLGVAVLVWFLVVIYRALSGK